ncbi:unnamed protein product [Sphagnum balticum]
MLGVQREIIYDTDGSLALSFDNTPRESATIVKGWTHLLQNPACVLSSQNTSWGGAAMCSQNVVVRNVMFANLAPAADFQAILMKAVQLVNNNIEETISPTAASSSYSSVTSRLDNMEPEV